MWDVLQKDTAVQKGTTALRVDVANAVRRLWKVDDDGRIPAWAPGTTSMLASGERCESVAEKRPKQRTTAYTGLLAHATGAQPRMTLINTE
jgi:hypothetical protein